MRRNNAEPALNPYIAFTDVLINLALVLLLFIPLVMLLGSRGWDDIRYRQYQQKIAAAVVRAIPADRRPEQKSRNDAPGEQRWTFRGTQLFAGDGADLTKEGRETLLRFAAVLTAHQDLWWRVRIEAHARQYRRSFDKEDELRSLRVTSERAVAVAHFLFTACHIPTYRLTTSGRGHQDLLTPDDSTSERNDRLDLLLIPPPASKMTR